ncbi:MAG: DNA cytosine methyltransferase [Oscillospiraceae bacterium]|nr:DNA cytosine methyltransferase [Oscillospiraceae bacterium]
MGGKKAAQISLLDEIIVDNFAGGGGASTGMELATGRPVTIAINHDPEAIKMHMANHPYTEHYQASVWDVDPVEVCHGRPVGLAWFSPDCKHFSRAKGGKPVSKNIRGLAWIVLRWAAKVRPRVIILENVPEFVTWGPVRKGKPVKSKSGQTFRKWLSQLIDLGYNVEYRKLKACDYGAPTIRERFFLVARCDGKPIVFPEPTHGSGKGLKPYRTAAECIDWTIPCKSIFGRKHPLKPNTMRRIAKGLDKFTIKAERPFIIPIGYGERQGQEPRVHSIDTPLSTVVSSCKQYAVSPHISKFYGGVTGTEVSNPMPTVTAIDHNALTAANLIQYHSETNASEVRGQTLDMPVMTVDASPRYALTAAHIVKYYSGDNYSSANAPLHTVTTKERNALVESHLCILRRNEDCRSEELPLPTITSSGAHFAEIRTEIVKYTGGANLGNWAEIRELLNKYCGYTMAEDEILLLEINGEKYFFYDIGMRMLEPKELYAAQGFPPDYIIDKDYEGKEYSRKEQVARCGNAVPPPFAEALVRANLPEWCGDKITTMHDFSERTAV